METLPYSFPYDTAAAVYTCPSCVKWRTLRYTQTGEGNMQKILLHLFLASVKIYIATQLLHQLLYTMDATTYVLILYESTF